MANHLTVRHVPEIVITSTIFESSSNSIPSIYVSWSVEEDYDVDLPTTVDESLLSVQQRQSDIEYEMYTKLRSDNLQQNDDQIIDKFEKSSCSCEKEFLRLLRESLQCPVCLSPCPSRGGGVFQCQHGHVICDPCLGRLRFCPVCRVVLLQPPIRNLALEQLTHLL